MAASDSRREGQIVSPGPAMPGFAKRNSSSSGIVSASVFREKLASSFPNARQNAVRDCRLLIPVDQPEILTQSSI